MSHVTHTKLGEGRRVVIPAELCQRYGLEPGDPVVLEPSDTGITVRPLDDVDRRSAGVFRRRGSGEGSAVRRVAARPAQGSGERSR